MSMTDAQITVSHSATTPNCSRWIVRQGNRQWRATTYPSSESVFVETYPALKRVTNRRVVTAVRMHLESLKASA